MTCDTDIVLGQIKAIRFSQSGKIALLAPLYRLNQEDGHWQSIAEPNQEFPNRGSVTWVNTAEEVIDGSVWSFPYDRHQRFDVNNPEHDRYRIDWNNLPKSPYELLDLKVRGVEDLCKTMNCGISLPFVPSHEVFLVVDEETWAGPLRLVKEGDHWKIDEQQRNLPIQLVTPVPHEHLKIEGRRRCFLLYGERPTTLKGEVDWSPDELVIKRVLQWVRKNDDSFANAVGLTKKIIDQAVDGLRVHETDILNQQVTRASNYIANATRLAEQIDQFKADLLEIPAVQALIETAKEQAREEAVQQAKAELEPLQKEKEQLTDEIKEQRRVLQKEISDAQKMQDEQLAEHKEKLRQLEQQIAERRRQLEQQIDLADEMLRERLAELMQRPQQALAEIALVRAVSGVASTQGLPRSYASRTLTVPPVLQSTAAPLDDEGDFINRMKRFVRSCGVNATVAAVLHAAFLSGTMPLVSGDNALEALACYASMVAGGRWLWVNVSPTNLEPSDLLGRFDPQSGRFLPHPSGLIDLLLHAAQPEQQDRLYVVVLDGVNRASVDTYLLPVLTCYANTLHQAREHTLSLVHPTMIAQDDPYAGAIHLQWPKNVLLAGTLIEGNATLPMPPAIWSRAVYIEATASRHLSLDGADSASHKTTEIQATVWSQWRDRVLNEIQSSDLADIDLPQESMQLSMGFIRNYARFHAVARRWLRDEQQLVSQCHQGCLIPYAIATQQVQALEQTPIDETDIAAMERILT